MKKNRISGAIFAIFLAFSYSQHISCSEKFTHHSMIELIANPEKFVGKTIQISGYLKLQFEGNAIYFSKEQELWGMGENAVLLKLTSEQIEQWKEFNEQYVYVRGKFNKPSGKYFGGFNLEMDSISRIDSMLNKEDIKKIMDAN